MTDRHVLRVAHVDTARDLRGGQRQLLRLARGLGKLGHQQLIVCPEGSKLESRARAEGFRVFAIPEHDPLHAHGAMLLRQQLKADAIEVIHAHDGQGQSLAWFASLALPVKRLASRRVIFLPRTPLLHALKYRYTCHELIAVSGYIRQLLIDSGIPASRIEVVPDGIELPDALPTAGARAVTRSEWGFSESEFVVGHVGAFTHEKGQDVAIEALRLLSTSLPQARLVLVGEGPNRDSLRFNVEFRDVRPKILFLGNTEDLGPFFAGLDLFVMPSRAEGLGSAALLAMAHGLAVIASRAGGLPEIIEDHQTGWLVPAGSPLALAGAIVEAASSPGRRAEFGRRGSEKARLFSTDIMVRRTEKIYLRLLEQAPNAR